MPEMISVKIDLNKLVDEWLFKANSGALYLDLILLPNRDGEDKYGNSHFVKQEMPRAVREGGGENAIIGNAKTIQRKGGQQDSAPPKTGGYQHRGQQQQAPAQRGQSGPAKKDDSWIDEEPDGVPF